MPVTTAVLILLLQTYCRHYYPRFIIMMTWHTYHIPSAQQFLIFLRCFHHWSQSCIIKVFISIVKFGYFYFNSVHTLYSLNTYENNTVYELHFQYQSTISLVISSFVMTNKLFKWKSSHRNVHKLLYNWSGTLLYNNTLSSISFNM